MLYAVWRVYSVSSFEQFGGGVLGTLISGLASHDGLYGLQGLECLKGSHVLHL